MNKQRWKVGTSSLTRVIESNRKDRQALIADFGNGAIDWDRMAQRVLALDRELNYHYILWLDEVRPILGPPDEWVEPDELLNFSLN